MKMNTTSKLAAALVAVAALTSSANAAFITGSIDFTTLGTGVTFDTGSLETATSVTNWGNPVVALTNDVYASVPIGTLVDFTGSTPWVFNPSTAYTPFWEVGNFSFALTSAVVTEQNAGSLVIQGQGIVSTLDSSLQPTNGKWFFTTQGSGQNGNFSFSSTTESVPDGGTTIALLGLSFLGLGGVSRLLRRK